MIDPKQIQLEINLNTDDFRKAFVLRVHQILYQGYSRLNANDYCLDEEPSITGELIKAMKDFLRSLAAPDWADNFDVHDDPPVNDVSRKGKRRNRIDIRVETSTPRPGNNFSIEAKRLGPNHTVGIYLGDEGLMCFLSGDYAREEREAGMVGYVQARDAEHWTKQIEAALAANRSKLQVVGEGHWIAQNLPHGPECVFLSKHFRSTGNRQIDIYHTLLLFLPSCS